MTDYNRLPDLVREVADLKRRLSDLERASRLPSASIGSGGLSVLNGGEVTLEGGDLRVLDGGTVTVEGGQFVVKNAGGTTVATLGTAGLSLTGVLEVLAGGDIDLSGGDLIADGGDVRSGNYSAGSAGFLLDGSTGDAEFNSITLRDGIVDLEALVGRVEAQTYGNSKSTGATNSDSLTISPTVPSWATGASVIAIGSVSGNAAVPGVRFTSDIDIDGTTFTAVEGSVGDTSRYDAISAQGHRTWSPSGTFDVTMSWGAAPLSATPVWNAYLTVLAVWSR